MTNAPIPITIITGFLGSGKTTLLNALLTAPALQDTAVIVNEFGEVGIDHLLIEQAIENAVLLKNGCVCCTVRGDVVDTLNSLWRQRSEGKIPEFRRIVIETTGLANPGPVAHTLVDPAIIFSCTLDGIVTTVDAMHATAQLARHEEARSQIALADRILLTKTDLASPNERAQVRRLIDKLNPVASVRVVIRGAADAADVFGLNPATDGLAPVLRWLGSEIGDAGSHEDRHQHHRAHTHPADVHGASETANPFGHDGTIGSVTISADEPLAWDELKFWLESILSIRGDRILRLKGLAQIQAHRKPLVLHGVRHVLHEPIWLDRWPIEPQTLIVLITDGLSARGLTSSFAAVTRTDPWRVGERLS